MIKAVIFCFIPVLKRLNALPREVRIKFWEQLEKLIRNPFHPSLINEELKGADQWAFSIPMDYRATYVREKTGIVITGVGAHKEILGK